MRSLIIRWLVNAAALLAVVHLVPGIHVAGWRSMLVAALVLGLLNAFLRPVILFLTLPVTVMTLGLFTLVVNGVLFYLAAHLVDGFSVSGLGSAFLGALVFSVASCLLNLLTAGARS